MNAISPIRKGSLSALDWDVIKLARTDGPRSLNPDGILAFLVRDILRPPIADAWADGRLEALRRFSIRAWHRDSLGKRAMREFYDAGFSSDDALAILTFVAAFRGFMPAIREEALKPALGLNRPSPTNSMQWRPAP